ncbi:conserved hypothetical protein [Pseudomonas syringae pv. tomato str. DC3000]|uniref:DUF2247 family protein n=2 Tax=Pseudomonas syringae group genomosp. 3 TaxID=251701 RepID=Q880F1_PSESM|nr:conserved hypothetical protein [Pseudomonas syringae pv. tomato str. DC3000]KKI26134.1 hypothetical protein WX98_10945 [Pseudomonas syringae pv. persicae]
MHFPMVPDLFIYDCVFLCWRDTLWGYERGLVGWDFVVGLANFSVSKGASHPWELELIFLGEFEVQEVEKKLRSLAEQEDERLGLDSQKKWLFIALKWLFENKNNIDDPLGVVELIYEDFGFPFEIEGFVRYMPSQDGYKPEENTSQQNIERIFCNWQSYLKRMAGVFEVKT